MKGVCYFCLYVYPYLQETCPKCRYHRRTVHRIDGKRGLKNDLARRPQVRANIDLLHKLAGGYDAKKQMHIS